jgi:RNA polymerase sigma factor (sigma-70 family)
VNLFEEAAEPPDDAGLVAGVLAGDREAFAALYDSYADRLHDFCFAILRDMHEAADAVQDTFVLVAERLAQLNDPARLRPWLYAVARSVALRRIRARKRVVLDIEAKDMADPQAGPQREAELAALRELVWGAAAGLSDRDQALLDLHVRQGLDGAELAEAMGVSTNHAYVLLTRLRDQVERSLGALLIARLGRADCTELDSMLTGWDGKFSPRLRKRVARHVEQCELCGQRKRAMVSPWALLAGVPLVPAPLYLRERVLGSVELVAHQGLARRRSRRRSVVVAAALLVVALGSVGAVVMWNSSNDASGQPVAQNASPGAPATGEEAAQPPVKPVSAPAATASTRTRSTTANPKTTTMTRPRGVPPTVIVPPTPREPMLPPPPPPVDSSPQITSQAATDQWIYVSGSGCLPESTSVQATIADDSGVASATLYWADSAGGSGGEAMTLREGAWHASLGPFKAEGWVEWRITAVDRAGNAVTGQPDWVWVDPCRPASG